MAAAIVQFDHDYVERRRVAERYVTGALSHSEHAWFERHVRHCEDCADEVELAGLFDRSRTLPAQPSRTTVQGGVFERLASAFTPAQQWAIIGASAMLLLLIPLVWIDSSAPSTTGVQVEPVIWLRPSGRIDVTLPRNASSVLVSAEAGNVTAVYRISIVDVASRQLWQGLDQEARAGSSLGLRVPYLPDGLAFAVVEQKTAAGSYRLVSRYPMFVQHQ